MSEKHVLEIIIYGVFVILAGLAGWSWGRIRKKEAKVDYTKVLPNEKLLPITENELSWGWYSGGLEDRKPGTPQSWRCRLQVEGGYMWYNPDKSFTLAEFVGKMIKRKK